MPFSIAFFYLWIISALFRLLPPCGKIYYPLYADSPLHLLRLCVFKSASNFFSVAACLAHTIDVAIFMFVPIRGYLWYHRQIPSPVPPNLNSIGRFYNLFEDILIVPLNLPLRKFIYSPEIRPLHTRSTTCNSHISRQAFEIFRDEYIPSLYPQTITLSINSLDYTRGLRPLYNSSLSHLYPCARQAHSPLEPSVPPGLNRLCRAAIDIAPPVCMP